MMAFAEFADDDEFSETDEAYSDYLTVEAYLHMHFGETGKQIYQRLKRMAQKTAVDAGGMPGIIFNDDGGEFVSFSDDEDEEEENY